MKRVAFSPISPMKKGKKQRMAHDGEGEKLLGIGQVTATANAILDGVKEATKDDFHQKAAFMKKQMEINRLNAEREQVNNEKAWLMQALNEKNVKLRETKEQEAEMYKKIAEYKEKTKLTLQRKSQLEKRIETERKTVEETVVSYRQVTARLNVTSEETLQVKEKIQDDLEKAKQKLDAAETDHKNLQAQLQLALEERRREWVEVTDLVETTRRKSEALHGDIEKTKKQIDLVKAEIVEKNSRTGAVTEQVKQLQKKLEDGKQFDNDLENLALITSEYEAAEVQLVSVRLELRAKTVEAQVDLQTAEREWTRDGKTLADLESQENIENEYHLTKVASLKSVLQEKVKAIEKLEEEAKLSQEKRRAEWEEKEKEHAERLSSQQKRSEELKREFELLSGMDVDSGSFGVSCREIQDFLSKLRSERANVISEIELLKRRAKEKENVIVEETTKSLPTKSPKALTQSQPETASGNSGKQADGRVKRADPKHVTFKNTPIIYEPASSQSSGSYPVVPSKLPVVPTTPLKPILSPVAAKPNDPASTNPKTMPVAPITPKVIPMTPSTPKTPASSGAAIPGAPVSASTPKRQPVIPVVAVRAASPRTPSPKRTLLPPKTPNPRSVGSNWSDSSDSSFLDIPRTQAFMRRPAKRGPTTDDPDAFGLF